MHFSFIKVRTAVVYRGFHVFNVRNLEVWNQDWCHRVRLRTIKRICSQSCLNYSCKSEPKVPPLPLLTHQAAPGQGWNPELTILALPDREVSDGLAGILLHADGDDLPLQSGRSPHHKRLQDQRTADESQRVFWLASPQTKTALVPTWMLFCPSCFFKLL